MDQLRVILSGISMLAFILMFIIFFSGNKRFLFILKNLKQINTILVYISFLSALFVNIIVLNLYQTLDFFASTILIIDILIIIVLTVSHFDKKLKKADQTFITIKKEEYKLQSEIELFNLETYIPKQILVLNKENEKIPIIFHMPFPDNNRNMLMKVKKESFYTCMGYVYEDKLVLDYVKIFLDIYTIIIFMYGYLMLTSKLHILTNLEMRSYLEGKIVYFLVAPIGYALFKYFYGITKNGTDTFTKFWHLLSMIIYIIIIIGLILIW